MFVYGAHGALKRDSNMLLMRLLALGLCDCAAHAENEEENTTTKL